MMASGARIERFAFGIENPTSLHPSTLLSVYGTTRWAILACWADWSDLFIRPDCQ